MEAVILDLDDTLIVEEATARASLAEALVLARGEAPSGRAVEAAMVDLALGRIRSLWYASPFADACRRLGIASWEGLWATFAGCHPSLDGLADWAPAYRRAAWLEVLRALDVDPGRASKVEDCYVAAQRRGHPPIPTAVEAARQLAATIPTGILTNGPPDIQLLKLAHTGLEFHPDAVVISGEVGTGKPEPAVFGLALERLGSSAAGTVMIGDSWERDVVGALGAGLRAVWVGKGRPAPEELEGVTVVGELTPQVLDRL